MWQQLATPVSATAGQLFQAHVNACQCVQNIEKIMAGSRDLVKIIAYMLCVIQLFTLTVADGHRLNVPRVLMPVFNDFPVNFTLEVTEGGCYQW